jgi:hypothetical protein
MGMPTHVRGLPRRDPFGQALALHPLATDSRAMFEGFAANYGSFRLPAGFFHRRTFLGFKMRPTSRFVVVPQDPLVRAQVVSVYAWGF